MASRGWFPILLTVVVACSKGSDKPAPGPVGPAPDEPTPVVAIDATPPSAAEACTGGDVASCDAVAERWSERQIVVAADLEAAKADAAALHVACDDRGESSACIGLALMYKYGTATGTADKATSDRYWARVAELGDLNGFRGAEPSEAGAAALAATRTACEAGRARACNQAGWAAFGAVQQEKNVTDAQAFYARGCAAGSGQGCHWAGHFAYVYPKETGAGAEAEAFLRKGCDLGSIGACDELGLYLAKNGKAADAAPLYEKACNAGARSACLHLAEYRASTGSDAAQVVPLFEKACKAGEKAACAALEDKGP